MKKVEEYINKCQKAIGKLTKNNANKQHIAIIHMLIGYTICNYKTSVRDQTAENHARKGIELDGQNYKGYQLLGYILKENKQFNEAIAAYHQCIVFCNDSKKKQSFEKQIKQIQDVMASNK